MIKTLFIISLFLLLVNGCNKPSCECETYKNIPISTKEWFHFKDSSWWVFRMAEDTTIFDTVTQVLTKDESSNNGCYQEYSSTMPCSEKLTIFYNHSNTDLFPSYNANNNKFGYHFITVSSPSANSVIFSMENGTSALEAMGRFLDFPLTINKKFGFYTVIDSTNGFEINKLNLLNTTIYLKYTESHYLQDNMTDIWWTKGVGIVKYIKSEGKKPKATWELTNYKIIK